MELKPCPFCGGTNIFVEDDGWGWVSYCDVCDANVSDRMTKKEAIDDWNKRVKL